MKKFSVLAIAAILFAACGGQKNAQNTESADSLKSFEQQQIEASIKMHIDSIAADLGKLKQLPFVQENNGGITLTKEEKQVKPDYLLPASAAEEVYLQDLFAGHHDFVFLSQSYRHFTPLSICSCSEAYINFFCGE